MLPKSINKFMTACLIASSITAFGGASIAHAANISDTQAQVNVAQQLNSFSSEGYVDYDDTPLLSNYETGSVICRLNRGTFIYIGEYEQYDDTGYYLVKTVGGTTGWISQDAINWA